MSDEKIVVAEAMEKFGGGFVKALGTALFRADANNTQRIKDAFPFYWDKYKTMGEQVQRKNDAKGLMNK